MFIDRPVFATFVCVYAMLTQGFAPDAAAQLPPTLTALEIVDEMAALRNATNDKDRVAVAGHVASPVYAVRSFTHSFLGSFFNLPNELGILFADAQRSRDATKLQEARTKILNWASSQPPLPRPDPPAPRITREEAVRNVVGQWVYGIKYEEPLTEAEVFDFARLYPDFAVIPKTASTKAYLVDACATALDRNELLTEINLPVNESVQLDLKVAEQWLNALSTWLNSNRSYLYFHPKERSLRLDVTARASGIPSADYRRDHPWGPAEGPNVTDPKKVPRR